ncbi:MAG: hypothetical protein CMJ11_07950 [Pelagibacterales bacterium]|nr:hypothetical protein [Pelagibacterales bacterium]|tara:strand:- start:1059 stop:1421 length:363 start_codon:yes stop_codon:yes gene_type:complete
MDFYLGTINCPGCGVENKLEIVDNFNSLSYEDQIKFLDNRTHILANSRTNSGEVNWYSYCVPCDILTKFYRKKTFFGGSKAVSEGEVDTKDWKKEDWKELGDDLYTHLEYRLEKWKDTET